MRAPLICYECAPVQALNPQTRAYLDQPDFQQMMRDMGGNPGNMNKYLADERFQNALQVCCPVVRASGVFVPAGCESQVCGFCCINGMSAVALMFVTPGHAGWAGPEHPDR